MTASALQRALLAHQTGDLGTAEREYRAVLKRDPRQIDALYLLGLLLHQCGRQRDAVEPLRKAVQGNSQRAEFSNTLGDVYRVLGRYDDARQQLERALALRPGFVEAQLNLAHTLNAANQKQDALVLLFNALGPTLQPGNPASTSPSPSPSPSHAALRQLLATLLQDVVLHTGNDLVRMVLLSLCTDATIATQSIAGAVLGLVKASPEYVAVRKTVSHSPLSDPSVTRAAVALMEDSLLQAVLPRIVVSDSDVEDVLRHTRHVLFVASADGNDMELKQDGLLTAMGILAETCFNTEYAWRMDAEESARVAELRDTLAQWLATPVAVEAQWEVALVRYAMYGALHDVPGWERLGDVPMDRWSAPMRPLIQAQVVHHLAERALAAAVPSFTSIADVTSLAVQAQYESNPYPRWLTLPQTIQTTIPAFVRSMRPELTQPTDNTQILVAGGGSGQQPLQMARTFQPCTITSMDLSRASLAYGARMAAALGIDNVAFVHGDILELAGSERRFGMVSCSGVLHHMHDPMRGWEILVRVLEPNGIMKIGLYSTTARTGITAARAFAAQLPVEADAAGIRAVRDAIRRLPDGHPARDVLAIPDFYSVSGCRDLVLHVQERTYTIPEIAECLHTLRLQFLGFQLPQPVLSAFLSAFPAPDALRDLHAWAHFESQHPQTFTGMYQFWCAPKP